MLRADLGELMGGSMRVLYVLVVLASLASRSSSWAGEATVDPAPARAAATAPEASPPPAKPAPSAAPATKQVIPAKQLFGSVEAPANLSSRAIGAYSRGCLAGAKPLAIDGPAWQAMRLSRNRNWGHPNLIKLIERFAGDAKKQDGWPGLLVGDISQPRGGPMLTGHASHQIGLDADIWFTPMPDRRLTEKEREDLSATSMLDKTDLAIDPKVWTQQHVNLVKRVASYKEVERVLVHPAIKHALCVGSSGDKGPGRAWLAKVRPYWGHYYHFHIRIGCPAGSVGCVPQKPIPGNDGCGKEVKDWLTLLARPPKPGPKKPEKPVPPVTLADLPNACRFVLEGTEPPPNALKHTNVAKSHKNKK